MFFKNTVSSWRVRPLIAGTLMALSTSFIFPLSAFGVSYTPPSFKSYQNNYGFYNHTTPLWYNDFVEIDGNIEPFLKEKALAKKYAPLVGVDPVLPVWWTYIETGAPNAKFDSYHYSYCGVASQETKYRLDINCADPDWGGWQIGYGQQFTDIREPGLLATAFKVARGNPNDAEVVRKVGQNVLNKSGIKKTFPAMTINQVMNGVNTYYKVDGNYWAYTLMRDPHISMYLLAKEMSWDINGGKARGQNYRQVMATWGAGYYDAHWGNFSNVLWDVLSLWRMTDAGLRP